MDTERPWTVKQFADVMSVSERTVLRWIDRGLVRSIRIGRVVRIPATEARRATEAATEAA